MTLSSEVKISGEYRYTSTHAPGTESPFFAPMRRTGRGLAAATSRANTRVFKIGRRRGVSDGFLCLRKA